MLEYGSAGDPSRFVKSEVKALSCALQGGAAGAALPAVLPALLTMIDDAAPAVQRTGEFVNFVVNFVSLFFVSLFIACTLNSSSQSTLLQGGPAR